MHLLNASRQFIQNVSFVCRGYCDVFLYFIHTFSKLIWAYIRLIHECTCHIKKTEVTLNDFCLKFKPKMNSPLPLNYSFFKRFRIIKFYIDLLAFTPADQWTCFIKIVSKSNITSLIFFTGLLPVHIRLRACGCSCK